MKNIYTLILMALSFSTFAELTVDEDLQRFRDKMYRINGDMFAHRDVEFVTDSLINDSEVFDEMKKDVLKNIESYKGMDGLIKYTQAYDHESNKSARNVAKLIFTTEQYANLKWGVTHLPAHYEFVRKYYQKGLIKELSSAIDRMVVGDMRVKDINIERNYSITYLSSTVAEFPSYGLNEIDREGMKKIRETLISRNGKINTQFIGEEGLHKYIETLAKEGVKQEYFIKEKLISVEISLSGTELRSLNWPIEFNSLATNESEVLRADRREKQRSLRGIKVIDVKRSVKKGKR